MQKTCLVIAALFLSVVASGSYAQQLPTQAELKALLKNADVVLIGKVVAVERDKNSKEPVSEHNPDWHIATVRVAAVLRGNSGDFVGLEGRLTRQQLPAIVRFAASKDVAWYQSPKLEVGEEKILILARSGGRTSRTFNLLGVQPRNNQKEVKRLLKELRQERRSQRQ